MLFGLGVEKCARQLTSFGSMSNQALFQNIRNFLRHNFFVKIQDIFLGIIENIRFFFNFRFGIRKCTRSLHISLLIDANKAGGLHEFVIYHYRGLYGSCHCAM